MLLNLYVVQYFTFQCEILLPEFELLSGCTLKLESGTPPCAALILNFYPAVHENLEVHNVQQFPI